MAVDVVLRQAFEFGRVANLDDLLAVVDIALEGRLLLGERIVEHLQARARRVVLVDAGEPKLQQLAPHIVLGGRIGVRRAEWPPAPR